MKMGRMRKAALVMAATVGLALPVAAAGAANAAVWDCASGRICGWVDGSYTGSLYQTTGNVLVYSATWNNKLTSVANHTTSTVSWHLNTQCADDWPLTRASNGVAEDLFWLGFNDGISSHCKS